MREYTVKEIAEMLSANEETVRRWIRDGKLKSEFMSKKTGHRISEANFNEFLEKFPKYAIGAAAGASLGSSVAGALGTLGSLLLPGGAIIGATVGSTVGLLQMMSQNKQKNNVEASQQVTLNSSQMVAFFRSQISETETRIHDVEKNALLLEQQLNATKLELSGLNNQLESYKTQLDIWTKINEEE